MSRFDAITGRANESNHRQSTKRRRNALPFKFGCSCNRSRSSIMLFSFLSHLVYSNEMRSGPKQMLAQIQAGQQAKMEAA